MKHDRVIGWMVLVGACLLAGRGGAPARAADDEGPADEPTAGIRLQTAPAADEDAEGPSLARGFVPRLADASDRRSLEQAYQAVAEYRYTEATERFQELLAKNPRNRRAWVGLSVAYTKLYRYADALQILERLIDEYPEDAAIKNNAAWIYATADDLSIRDGERAVGLAREALVQAPGSFHIWSTMAEGYYVTGNYDQALAAAREALLMGLKRNANPDNMREYRTQVKKMTLAVQAMTLME